MLGQTVIVMQHLYHLLNSNLIRMETETEKPQMSTPSYRSYTTLNTKYIHIYLVPLYLTQIMINDY